ncbi:GTPase family protein [Yersinia pseudotuberculosis]|uniref:GTP-binding protein HSR1-related n=1 Tax=Yersinia pseudotuberculosis serotype O:3 (strain YPIII) TaxID=502800 RepID=A0A0H3B784_YERPY|nr:GTPase [Yersinia pseudotuberculosis]AJJ58605.1 dynamin family protein [Yersinia pseudotuberculosis YPIII]AXY32186.1 GTP-binding protein HSR1 [Yersinia pseudotuberculosis]AYW89005.1 GTP-binding protein HSR1 [Yersinia pseudotuberculosis]AYW99753.1 GTP-binding protein HSR1 [Yersinia pseudotuberculosis]AYX11856.1 GTP-binding protein HSR1 [Yersinia pseudotuberculosis]
MKQPSGYTLIRRHLRRYPRSLRQHLLNELNRLVTYEPVIGIMGKTGVGKSSLCNALFRSESCAVNAVKACTRQPQRVRLRFGSHYLTLIDLPGVGENQQRDGEYRELYREQLPELDMVLWVLKADDRAFSVEEQFHQAVFEQYNGVLPPVLWILNQVDKTEPSEQWNWSSAQPSAKQAEHITLKQQAVARQMRIDELDILSVSVRGRYHLSRLVEAMITRLPKQARSPLVPHLQTEYRTTGVISSARSSFGESVVEVINRVIDLTPLPQVARRALQAVTHSVTRAAGTVWSFFFG